MVEISGGFAANLFIMRATCVAPRSAATRRTPRRNAHRKVDDPMPKGQEKKKTTNKPKLTVKEKKAKKKEKK
jgi:hypothetical protein